MTARIVHRGLARQQALAQAPADPLLVLRRMGFHGGDQAKWTTVLRRDPCVYCGKRHAFEEMTVDHIRARARGAGKKHAIKNAAPACHGCNQAKADASLLEFLACRLPRRSRPRRALGVVVHRGARRDADEVLGINPGADWWDQVAAKIASRELRARSVKFTDGKERAQWVVPVRSVDGVELDLLILARVEIMAIDIADDFRLPT